MKAIAAICTAFSILLLSVNGVAQTKLWETPFNTEQIVGIYGTAHFAPDSNVVVAGATHYFEGVVVKRSPNGSELWRYTAGSAFVTPYAMFRFGAFAPNGDVYVTSINGQQAVSIPVLLRLNGSTGQPIWTAQITESNTGQYNPEPVYVLPGGDILVTSWIDGKPNLAKVRAADGAVLGQSSFDIGQQSLGGHMPNGDPIYSNSTRISRINVGTLTLRWNKPVDPPTGYDQIAGSRVAVSPTGGLYMVGVTTTVPVRGFVFGFDPKNGTRFWERVLPAPLPNASLPGIAFDSQGNLFISADKDTGGSGVYRLNTGDGNILWAKSFADVVHWTDADAAGNLVVYTGTAGTYAMTRLRGTSGGVMWKSNLSVGAGMHVIDDTTGRIYFQAAMPATWPTSNIGLGCVGLSGGGVKYERTYPIPYYYLSGGEMRVLGDKVVTLNAPLSPRSTNVMTVYGAKQGLKLAIEGLVDRDIGYNRPLPPIAVGNDVLVASYSECVFGSQQVWTLSRLGPDGHRVWQRGFVQPPTWLPDEVANGGLRGLAIGGTSLFALGTLDALFTLKKLDPATGAVAWSVSRADTPRMLTALPNGDAIVYVNSLTAMRVSGTDGSVLWQAPMPVSWIEETTSSSATQPVRNYAVALDTNGDNIVRSGSSIYRVNSADGSIVWNKTLPGFSENARFVADHFGYPYVVTRGTDEVILTKLISVDGSPVFTKHYSVPGIVSVPSNVILASDDVVCWSEIRADGRLWVVGASTADGTLKWSAKLGGLNAATVVSPYVNLAVTISGIAFVVGTSGVDNPAQFTGCLDLPHHSRLWLKIGMPYKSFHYWVTVTGDDSAVVTGTDWAVEQSARIAKAIRYRAR